jgi:hypothetical protein
MRKLFFLIALLACAAAAARGNYQANGKVLGPGDPMTKVLDTLGEPVSKEPVENKYGAQEGEYWYYRDGNKTVKFFISGGRIVDIEEIR